MPNLLRFIAVLMVLFSGVVTSNDRLIIDEDQSNDFECKFVVKEGVVEFRFLNEISRYPDEMQWNKRKGSAIEYSWFVYLDLAKTSRESSFKGIDFGIRYFMRNGGVVTGTIAQLVKDSDIMSFSYLGDGSFVPSRFEELTVDIVDSDLVLVLKKTDNTSFIFNELSKIVYFWVFIQDEMARKCRSESLDNSER